MVPPIDTQALDGTAVHLPDGRQPTLLVLGFTRKSGDGVRAWGKTLTHEPWNMHAATVYELAFLGEVPKPFRGLVLRSIRKQVSTNGQTHFLPLYTNAQPWKTIASAKSDDDVYLLLLDASGAVRWRGHGPYSTTLDAEVNRQVASLGAQ